LCEDAGAGAGQHGSGPQVRHTHPGGCQWCGCRDPWDSSQSDSNSCGRVCCVVERHVRAASATGALATEAMSRHAGCRGRHGRPHVRRRRIPLRGRKRGTTRALVMHSKHSGVGEQAEGPFIVRSERQPAAKDERNAGRAPESHEQALSTGWEGVVGGGQTPPMRTLSHGDNCPCEWSHSPARCG
jgi:hypothetical protein